MVRKLVGWWVVLLAAYVVLVSSLSGAEWIAGAVLAALASVVPAVTIHGFGPSAPPRRLHWRHLLWLPLDIVRDTVALTRRLAGTREHAGRIDEERLPALGGHAAVRAYAVLVVSTSPGSYVLDVEPGQHSPGDIRIHRLAKRRAGDRVVSG